MAKRKANVVKTQDRFEMAILEVGTKLWWGVGPGAENLSRPASPASNIWRPQSHISNSASLDSPHALRAAAIIDAHTCMMMLGEYQTVDDY